MENQTVDQNPSADTQTTNINTSHNLNKKLILTIGGVILLIIISILSAYYLGTQKNNNITNSPASNSDTNSQNVDETPIASPSPMNSNNYTNSSMNFSLNLPENYEVISENPNEVIFGVKPIYAEKPIPYLTISKNSTITYKTLQSCNPTPKPGCGDTTSYSLDGYKADYTKVFNIDASYDEVTITDPSNTQGPEQLKMIVAGPSLPQAFEKILESFTFIK